MMKNIFVEKKASKMSLACRTLIHGIGVNDSSYITEYKIDGERHVCPYYKVWVEMLRRCYSEKWQTKYPTYLGCTATKEWHLFSNFKKWMKKQDWQGKALDKDILIVNNKVYSPKTCVFVSGSINTLLAYNQSNKEDRPTGVYFDKNTNKYNAGHKVGGKKKHLGCFTTPEEASKAFKISKSGEIRRVAELQADIRVKDGLIRHADFLINEVAA